MTFLKVGQPTPDFRGTDQNGNIISLDMFRGKKLVLYFYPKDSTPGCTAEACNLRDNYHTLLARGLNITGVSADNEKSHKKFSENHQLPFPLLADTEKTIIQAYGVWGEKKFMGKIFNGIHRTTFLISEEGIIEHIFDKVQTKSHTEQILDFIDKKAQ
jgi:peroxiredoxin Q/BCP